MQIDYPPLTESATPEYILSVLQDEHRQASRYDSAVDKAAVLTMETTIAEWREACDLIPPRPLGRALNETWGLNLSDDVWASVLGNGHHTTLRSVCELIALTSADQSSGPGDSLLNHVILQEPS